MDLPVMPPVKPMLAKAVSILPRDMLYEPKFDGFRCIVFRDGDEVEMGSRKELPMARYFPELVAAAREQLPPRCVVDGEVVLVKGNGLDFELLQQRIHPAASRIDMLSRETPASLIAFDLLALGDESLLERPFVERRAALEAQLGARKGPVYVTPLTESHRTAERWFRTFEGAGLVGVTSSFSLARREELLEELGPYRLRPGDSHPWLGAVTAERVPGALSRWSGGKDLSWEPLRPDLVVEVAYDHMEGRRFRHTAQFRRWRPDREPRSCGYDQIERPVAYDLTEVLETGRV